VSSRRRRSRFVSAQAVEISLIEPGEAGLRCLIVCVNVSSIVCMSLAICDGKWPLAALVCPTLPRAATVSD
jgi:hypothetical protein